MLNDKLCIRVEPRFVVVVIMLSIVSTCSQLCTSSVYCLRHVMKIMRCCAEEDEELEAEVTHGRTNQIKHHVSRKSMQIKRSASLSQEDQNRWLDHAFPRASTHICVRACCISKRFNVYVAPVNIAAVQELMRRVD